MKHPAGVLMAFFLVLTVPACRLIMLPEAISVQTFPSRRNQILAAEERIYVRFDFPVDALSAEECLAVRSGGMSLAGLKSWEAGTLYFTPQPGLVYGQRYVLSLAGTLKGEKGRSVDLSREIPFYYIAEDEAPPVITCFLPAEGARVDVAAGLRLSFSKPMDPSSFREGFALQPDHDYALAWNPEQTEVTVAPEPEWENSTVYEAEVRTSLLDALGIPLTAGLKRTFYAAADLIAPEVGEPVPALRDWAGLFPTRSGATLADLEYRDVIKIVFSEAMDAEKSAAAVSLDPSPALFKIWTDPSTLVLVPDIGFEMDREYRLIIGGEAADLSGNTLTAPFCTRFTTAIPLLTLASVNSLAPDFPLTEFSSDRIVDIDVGAGPVYTCMFTLIFSGAGFPTDAEKLAAQQNIILQGLFPSGLLNPAPMGYGWVGDNIVEITFAGFEPPDPATDAFYMLEIPGGAAGLSNATGSFLKEDIRQLLRVKP
jgi:hypothetical protein